MTSTIQVFLDNHNDVCYPGQTIAGRVECNFNKQKNLRAIRIKFKGRCETEWSESESYYDHATKKNKTRRVRYTGEEEYFNAEYILVQGGDNFSLSSGRHSYPFSYILPQQLPSSFEGDYGHIRYTIKATVDRPWKFDYEAIVGLNIVSPLDLNYLPRVREPAATSVDKNLCCCWCKSGPLTFDVSLPATGYVPGQEVNVGAYVQNMTNVSSDCVQFKIVKELEFITLYPSTRRKYAEYVIAGCREGGIGAHGEKSWTSVLKIPVNESYPNLIPCNIINISYRLKAKVELPCPHTNLDADFPFMIGNVPLAGLNTSVPGPPPSVEFPLPNYNSLPTPYPPQPGATAPPPEAAPLLSKPTAPYPSGDTKYSPTDSPPYPSGDPSAPGGAPYPAGPPYPSGGASNLPQAAPYPSGGASNLPQATSNSFGGPPYPSGGAPYPSVGAPYPSVGAPYPSGGSPYPSEGTPYPSGSAPYPSGGPPYPSGGAPYPPGSVPSEETKQHPKSIWSQPEPSKGADAAFALPSYEEAQKLKEKEEKHE